MKKKMSFLALFIGLNCLLLMAFTNVVEKICVKQEYLPQRKVSVEHIYRGTNRVLTITKEQQRTLYAFRINGKTVAAISDETNGDGYSEKIMIFDPDTDDFDEFVRSTNGSVTPINSSELEDLKVKASKAAETFEKGMSHQSQVSTNRSEP
jgi:hypothetical protein